MGFPEQKFLLYLDGPSGSIDALFAKLMAIDASVLTLRSNRY